MKVLVTGGTGSLGRAIVPILRDAGHSVRIMSRRPRPDSVQADVEWAQADIVSGEGLPAALDRAEAIVHAATDPRPARAVDVEGTRRLVEAARAADVSHLVYISIVGIDRIPFSYYRRKLAAEKIIESSGLPHTTLRATQFHSLVASLIKAFARVPLLMPLPTEVKFQSVDAGEVAARLAECLVDGPAGRVTDFGGPEVLTLGRMAQTWMEVKGVRGKRIVRLPVPGKMAQAFREGRNTAPTGARGVKSWREWLRDS